VPGVRISHLAISSGKGPYDGLDIAIALGMGSWNRAFLTDYHGAILNESKREICNALYRVQRRKDWDQRQMAKKLGTTQSRISHVLCPRPERTTFDQLFTYLVIAEPNFKILISI
jgi:predicted XRE-type DNA-binding protein